MQNEDQGNWFDEGCRGDTITRRSHDLQIGAINKGGASLSTLQSQETYLIVKFTKTWLSVYK